MSSLITSGSDQAWYQHITIDLLARVLSNSVFHPFVAWMVPLCLRSLQAPYDSIEFVTACTYAGIVTLCWLLSVINKRAAYGIPRQIDWDTEVVVITGGAHGLGKVIAEMYGMRGANVAVLDITKPDKESEGLAGVQFYACDISDAEAVENVAQQIEHDVGDSQLHVVLVR